MSCEGELRCLPFDFEVEGVAWTLGEACPGAWRRPKPSPPGRARRYFYPL